MRLSFFVQEDVSWFDITMKNAVFVRVMNSTRHLRNEFSRLSDRHRRAFNDLIKLPALDELHAEIAQPIMLAYLIDGHYTRISQAGGSFGFAAKAFQVRLTRPL